MKKLVLLCVLILSSLLAVAESPLPTASPDAVIDLATDDGVSLVNGQWRYSDTKIVETEYLAPGDDGQPGTERVRTYDYQPHAGVRNFDDSGWPVIPPMSLSKRRSTGRLSFNWYRITVTVPERIGNFDPTGSTIVFETSLDDYAEIWVDGELSRSAGQSGGSVIAGWNAANNLVIARNAKPGKVIQLAVFGINGPISNPPTNYIWMRYARLHFYSNVRPGPVAITPSEVNVEVIRKDPAIDEVVPLNAKIYKLAEGFKFIEGPVWIRSGNYLLFSDPNNNTIYKYTNDGQLSVFREKSGYDGVDIAEYTQPGSNGLALDPQGRLTINQHGNRRVIRIEADGRETVLVDRFEGKRLNSPNDLVYRSDGTLFFTDPPFGLPKFHKDPRKELSFEGVYSLHEGKIQLLSTGMTGPNGIALSPDEKHLYVGNWDDKKKVVYRYEVQTDGTVKNGAIFFDMTDAKGEDAIDGIKVDVRGNLYVSGPDGLWIISPEAKHLGTIIGPRHPHNMAWGGEDGKTLFLTAQDGLYRITLKLAGAGISQ